MKVIALVLYNIRMKRDFLLFSCQTRTHAAIRLIAVSASSSLKIEFLVIFYTKRRRELARRECNVWRSCVEEQKHASSSSRTCLRETYNKIPPAFKSTWRYCFRFQKILTKRNFEAVLRLDSNGTFASAIKYSQMAWNQSWRFVQNSEAVSTSAGEGWHKQQR